MAIRGRKPKPDDEKVTRHPLTQGWIEVPDVAFASPEPIGPYPNTPLSRPDREHLRRCLEGREKHRSLLADAPLIKRGDELIQNPLAKVVERLTKDIDRLVQHEWTAGTRTWWRHISTMPHCILWSDAQWQYARETALVHDRWVRGDRARAGEMRQREAIMGTTLDARRDLRIRYVSPMAFAPAPTEDGEDPGRDRMADFSAERRRKLMDAP